jgi:nucleotide-binding universal stress UspA family protein
MLPIRTILHPTDFSPEAERAFQLACSLARDYGATLVVLHVFPLPISHGEVVARRQPDGVEEALWTRLHGMKPSDPKVTVDYRLEEGNAVPQILRVAGECNCELIVMGTHGRSGLGRLLLGSVAEQVVRQAPCAVLTVRPPLPHTSS